MTKIRLFISVSALLGVATTFAQVFPDALPANRSAAGLHSLRNLALGEPRFTNAQLYNLYDQGGSPMGLLETRKEKVGLAIAYLGSNRATDGDSLAIGHGDFSIPQLGFFQPGVFGASLYYQRESESYHRKSGDSLDVVASLFGLDLAAGPASGLFRIGFGAHARLGSMEYAGEANRVILEVPSLRFDLGSRLHPAVEVGVYAGFGGRFDSLESPAGRLERVATMTLPRYGILADMGGTETLPVMGNAVLELGTDRFFGEYRQAGGIGIEYPIVWTRYWTFQTQWMYPFQVRDFRLEPALRFARRSEDAQGYAGLKGNQDPFKKGDKIDALQEKRGITAFGLGGNFSFRETVSLLLEWETSGHGYEVDSLQEERYNRFSLGLEHRVDHDHMAHFPENMSLALRTGWTWRDDAKSRPGYRDFHFNPFLPTPLVPTHSGQIKVKPDDPSGYSAFHLGFGLGLLKESLGLEGLLSFPGQLERFGTFRTEDASGMELGVTLMYRVL